MRKGRKMSARRSLLSLWNVCARARHAVLEGMGGFRVFLKDCSLFCDCSHRDGKLKNRR